jgi:hypothetical protein
MKEQINEYWKRIEIWLNSNCPILYGYLGNGLDETDIIEIETKVNKKLPDDFVYSLQRHDGVTDFRLILSDGRDSFELLRKDRVFEALDQIQKRESEIKEEFRGGDVKENIIDLLPIGYFSSGDYLYLNLVNGIVQFISHDGDNVERGTFGDILKMNADNLENGNYGILYNVFKTPMVRNLK